MKSIARRLALPIGGALVLALTFVAAPSGAAPLPAACPTEAALVAVGGFVPPFVTGTAVTGLVDCATPITGAEAFNLSVTFGELGVVDDGCSTVSAIEITITGTPSSSGYLITSYDPTTQTLVPLASGADAFFQAYDSTAGQILNLPGGGVGESPTNQPSSGTYSVTGSLDPSVLSLADLAAGHLAAAILAIDGTDSVTSITATVTLDSSACSSSTTTTTAAPTTTTTTATAVAAAVEVAPVFTG